MRIMIADDSAVVRTIISQYFGKNKNINIIASVSTCQKLLKNLTVENPYEFFINELNGKTYTPQNSSTGISVFPYKLSAAAHFKYKFVIILLISNAPK